MLKQNARNLMFYFLMFQSQTAKKMEMRHRRINVITNCLRQTEVGKVNNKAES